MKCEFCGKDTNREEWCDWQQGRCPKRKKLPMPGLIQLVIWGLAILFLLLTYRDL